MHRLTINSHLPRLMMDPVKSDKALEIWLNTLRLTTPNIDTELHKTRGVQLMKLKVKSFQHANNKRVRRKPQAGQEQFLINNNLIIMRIENNISLRRPRKISSEPTSLRELIQVA